MTQQAKEQFLALPTNAETPIRPAANSVYSPRHHLKYDGKKTAKWKWKKAQSKTVTVDIEIWILSRSFKVWMGVEMFSLTIAGGKEGWWGPWQALWCNQWVPRR